MRTHSELMAAAEELLSQHNDKVQAAVSLEQFREKVTALGGTTREALALIEAGDLNGVENLPVLVARLLVKIFRDQSEGMGDTASDEPKAITAEQCREASDRWLIDNYDWCRPNSLVVEELQRRATEHGQPARFIVVDGDGKIHISQTLRLLKELRQGHPPVETTPVNGVPREVILLGDKPDEYHHEHPLIQGKALRGQLDEDDRDWVNGLKLETRLILRLAVGTSELSRPSRQQIREIFERYSGDDGLTRAHQDFPRATVEYGKRKEAGTLPTLRIQIGRQGRRPEKRTY